MKSYLKFLLILFISISISSSAFSAGEPTTTRIIVIEGKVICFDVPPEFAKEELFVITIINREDAETGKGDKDGEIVRFYIPEKLRDQIGDRIQPNAYGLCMWNIRRLKQTVCDLVAIGTVVKAGYEFSNGIATEAPLDKLLEAARPTEPAISQTTPVPGTPVVNKDEDIIKEGEGGGTSIPPPDTSKKDINEPTPPTTLPPSPLDRYVDAQNGNNANDGTSWDTAWKTVRYAVDNAPGLIYLRGTFAIDTETLPIKIQGKSQLTLRKADDQPTPVFDGSDDGTGPSTTQTHQLFTINSSSYIDFRNIDFRYGNAANGGAMEITNSTVAAISCNFSNNQGRIGGAINITGPGSVYSIIDCAFTTNSSSTTGGGAVYIGNGASLRSIGGIGPYYNTSSTFSTNWATLGGHGGAIYVDTGGTLTLNYGSFSFSSNDTQTGGGRGGAILASQPNTLIINRATFNGNTGRHGGAIHLYNSTGASTVITNSLFYTNSTSGSGAAILCSTASPQIVNCTFDNNTATGSGNGICMGDNSDPTITNCIFRHSNGIVLYAFSAVDDLPQITNTDCYDVGEDNNIAFNGAGEGNVIDFGGWTWNGSGCIQRDPRFKAGTYMIDATTIPPSPCLDTGATVGLPEDILGNPRPALGGYDMGCYEMQALTDPPITGTVYDSVTGENISSPVVGLYNANTNTQVGVTTSNPYTFNVDPGKYYFAVSKDGYAFPSQIISSTTSGDHGDIFTASNDPLTINIPMDPDGWLVVEKKCNKERVEIGDIVTYRITVQNKHWYKSVENVELVDELVNGFKYVNTPNFNLGTVSAYSTQTITYQVRVGSAVPPGRYKTTCYTRKTTTGARNSNIDTSEIEVVENPLFTSGTIIGKVFWDFNGNGVQDSGELGIGGIKIYTEYGVVVETDPDGKYHIADVPAGNHLLKIDTTELPNWISITTDNPYYVKITEGLLAKVNFGVQQLASAKKSNQFFIVALGEGIVRNLDTSGNIEMVEKDDRYDDGVNVDGRLAFYLKGKILGKYLIKASIDTDRRTGKPSDRRTLFTNLDPDKYYPVYGDASKVDYSGVDTQDIVYVIIEWDESFAKWGSFHTALPSPELPLYNRTLNGGIINYNSIGKTKFGDTRTKIKGFGAFSRQKPAHDEFVGTGGSLYYLRHDDIIEGSEKIRVEVRDRLGKITVNSIPLLEEKDYEIDYDTGRVLLKRPLNSIQQAYNNSIISNDILMGERVYLVVDYEYYSDGLSDQAWGVNASQWLGNHIRVGGTYVEEQKTGDPYKLMGGEGTVKINKDTEVNVNYSRTEETQLGSTISYDGGLTFTEQGEQYSLDKSGSALTVDGRTRLFNNTDISLVYSRQDPYYSVTNSISSQGSQKYLANIITKLTETLSIGLTHLTQKYYEGSIAGETFGATDSYTTTGILDWRPGKWDLRGEYQHQEVNNPITSYTYFGTLPLLENDFIAGRIGYQLFSWLHPYIRGQVTVNGDANDQGTVGADINIGRNTTINLAETVGTLGDSTLLGLTTKITETTDVYANLEVGNHTKLGKYTKTTYGQSTQLDPTSKAYVETDYSSYRENIVRGNLLGYKKKITDTLGLGLTYERSNVKNNTTAIDRDVGAVSLSYLNPEWLKAYSKLEIRNDIGTNEIRQWVTQNDILWYTTPWLSLSGRCNWGWTENQDTEDREAEFYEVAAGFSLRPVTWDKVNILGKYSYTTDYPPDSQWDFPLDIESIKNIYSIEGIYDLFKYLSLVGKFSYRDMSEKVGTYDWVDSDTYLYIARTNFHILNSEPDKPFLLRGWDFAVEYRILANDQIEDEKEGFLVELDKDLGPYIRCGVGYNFTDYDDDLRNDDNWDAKGWFFKLAGKY